MSNTENIVFDSKSNSNLGSHTVSPVKIQLKEPNNAFDTFVSLDFLDINLTSFLSSINFIDILTDISERMGGILIDQQMKFLRHEMFKINNKIPANLYIPFLKKSIRNYIICHIPVTELRIFRTKNRAPFLITFEVIRIDELNE